MKLSMVGTGYVGLTTGALFADRGNQVTCVDTNSDLVKQLCEGNIHIFEPGLENIVQRNVSNGNLNFTTDIGSAVRDSNVIFLAVGTPSNGDGSFSLEYLKQAAKDIGKELNGTTDFKVVVGKSTVPQGTSETVLKIINEEVEDAVNWAYVSNPETLAEGTAVKDFEKPSRIIIGTDSDEAFLVMKELYHPFNIQQDRIMRGSPADAELAKLFSNAALATRIAMVNEFARIADTVPGADMDTVRKMVCEDPRIGYQFMFPSPGYGGSCFPKDVQGLVARAKQEGYEPLLLNNVHRSNELHKHYLGEKVSQLLTMDRPKVGVWGVTFKPNTDDMREAASIPIITGLINRGVEVIVYDPQDNKARDIFGDRVEFAKEKYEAVEDTDALILLTEWKEFDSPDFNKLREKMNGNQLFDLRNRWLPQAANRVGFSYHGVGRNYSLGNSR
ncbi:UDP-glucose/GDP-mannose dehydrogenase family protein [Candidatus Woesearchaeota archaeon]|nr:UDP-glucose/GDP-mannose dehydrogenase family protein [Candidatus Woesearchaeota archaeon]